jgi:hypothetical protein
MSRIVIVVHSCFFFYIFSPLSDRDKDRDDDAQWSLLYIVCVSGHSTHFQVGGDNPKVEGGIMQNQYAKQRLKPVFYFYFDIFIFENKSSRGKCN